MFLLKFLFSLGHSLDSRRKRWFKSNSHCDRAAKLAREVGNFDGNKREKGLHHKHPRGKHRAASARVHERNHPCLGNRTEYPQNRRHC